MTTTDKHMPIVILAGGRGRRLGNVDKCLLPLAGSSVLQHLLFSLAHQSEAIYLNANGELSRFVEFNLPIIKDTNFADAGPLAGVINAMQHFEHEKKSKYFVTIPGDCPFVPKNYVQALFDAFINSSVDLVYASANSNKHYVCAIWSVDLLAPLQHYLQSGARSVGQFIHSQNFQCIDFSHVNTTAHDENSPSHFFNINTPEQLTQAEELLQRQQEKNL